MSDGLKTRISTASGKKGVALPVIGNYKLLKPWTTAGSGSATWSFAERDGKEYFIKCFLAPVCASADSGCYSAEEIAEQRKLCNAFYQKKRRVYDAVNRSANGNIVKIEDFFFYKTKYYLATDKVENVEVSPEQIAQTASEKKLLLLRVLAFSMASLHRNGVVHGDMKIENVLFKKGSNHDNLIPKLIDFGDSYLADEPTKNPVGDVYLAPEIYRYMDGEDVVPTQKADIFSLGLMFHQFYCGRLPSFDRDCQYACDALLDGRVLRFDRTAIPRGLLDLIEAMVATEPEDRPDAGAVFDELSVLTGGERIKPPPPPPPNVWKCSRCGTENKAHASGGESCAKCGRPRNADPDPLFVRLSDGW